jgi:hypothetical protein
VTGGCPRRATSADNPCGTSHGDDDGVQRRGTWPWIHPDQRRGESTPAAPHCALAEPHQYTQKQQLAITGPLTKATILQPLLQFIERIEGRR